jgi:hypothetical protein
MLDEQNSLLGAGKAFEEMKFLNIDKWAGVSIASGYVKCKEHHEY